MDTAVELLKQMTALFVMMGLGFLLVKSRLLKSSDSRGLSVILIWLIGPAVILRAFQISFTDEVRDGFLLAVGAALLIHVLLFGICRLYGRLIRFTPVEKASVMYSNAGNLIVPLVTELSFLGESYVIFASAFMCVQLFFLWTHGRHLISGEQGFDWKKILLNPNLIAAAAGLVMFLTGLRLPEIPAGICRQLASAMGPVSMIMLGMILAAVRWRKVLTGARTWLVMGLKMVGTPLIILLCLKLTGLAGLAADGKTILFISFMAVMTPAATTVTQLAQMYDSEPDYAAAVNVLTTVICIVTMPLLTALYWLIM